jgi:hypothetical protein
MPHIFAMMTRSQGRNLKFWTNQKVAVENPPVTSAAALVLLIKKYLPLDKSIYTDSRMSRLRNSWLKKQMKTPDEEGGLTCAICKRKGLKPHSSNKKKLATLDHIVNILDGGSWNDPSNFQVACVQCNTWKNVEKQRRKKLALTFYKSGV